MKLLRSLLRHKMALLLLALVAIGTGSYGYRAFVKKQGPVRYVFGAVQKGTLVVSVSANGQVSVSNQVEIKPKVSGDVEYVGIKNGQAVNAGALIVRLNTREAQKAVRDAEVNLSAAKLLLLKLKKPADALSILQADHALVQAKESKQKAEDNLKKAYEDGFNAVANAFLSLPTIMAGLDGMFFDNTIERSQDNIDWYLNQTSYENNERDKTIRYRDDLIAGYALARSLYTKNFESYRKTSRASPTKTIESLILETYETTKTIADAVKMANNFVDFVSDAMEQRRVPLPSSVATHQSTLDSYTGTTNNHLVNLLTIKRSIEDSKEAITNAKRLIDEKSESLAKLKTGPDFLDVQSQELTIKQRENALLDAQEKLTDYFIRAPFDGIIAKTDVKLKDALSSATTVAVLVTAQKLAEVSLNEIDVAKVNAGQRVTIAFDAIPDLTITGHIAELDAVGTISQGVVTYNVKIAFDTQDGRVKPAMSVTASIITAAKPDVLLVPNTAVKTDRDTHYVEMSDEPTIPATPTSANGVILQKPPRRQDVTVGLSNDEFTEITGGLSQADRIVTRVIQPNAAPASATRPGGFQIPGLSPQGGNRQIRGFR